MNYQELEQYYLSNLMLIERIELKLDYQAYSFIDEDTQDLAREQVKFMKELNDNLKEQIKYLSEMNSRE